MSDRPKLYDELAGWFHLLTTPADYAEEAADILALWRASVDGPLETALELGSGGGNTASHLHGDVRMTLTDVSPAMLELSRTINPDAEHIAGDMRTLRLGRPFDAVLIHDAIMYMTIEDDLRAAIETAFVHCRPGGAAVIAPDCVAETFAASTETGGHDERPDGTGRALRYLEWSFDPDPSDTTTITDFAILLREPDGSTRVVHDRHVEGLFPRRTWRRLVEEAGFTAEIVVDRYERDLFVARRPA